MPVSVNSGFIDHIEGVFETLSESPYLMDIVGPGPHPTLSDAKTLLVMIDHGIHVELTFIPHPRNGCQISSISCGMFTDLDLVTDSDLYPEVRFEINRDSHHSLAWESDTTIDEVVSVSRMRKLLHITRTMKERLSDVFADESLM